MVELRIPGVLSWRNTVIRFVAEACRIMSKGLVEPDGNDRTFEAETISAFGEAFNNVAIHGYTEEAPGQVIIQIECLADRLVISMADHGRSFNPDLAAPPDLDDLPEHGMGIFIMKSFMDDVLYQPGNPNVLRLTKLRPGRQGGEGSPHASGERLAIEVSDGPASANASATGRSGYRMRAVEAPRSGEVIDLAAGSRRK